MANEEIDLRKLFKIGRREKKKLAGIVAGVTLLTAAISFIIPPTYTSTALVQTRSATTDLGTAASLAGMLGVGNTASPTAGYIEMMKSRTVLEPIIQSLDWWDEDEKERVRVDKFAKKYLNIQNIKNTNLISISADGKTPEESQRITQAIVDNFLSLMTDMNKQTQSLLVTFLSERINTSKQEMDDASRRLEAYSKEHKVYEPSGQAKAQLEMMAGYDKVLSNLKVQQEASQAKIGSIEAELGKQNEQMLAYNVADNSTVQNLRAQIVNKELEIVSLRQKYQEKHPSLIAANNELAALKESLAAEVSDAVSAGTVTMNPAQAEIVKQLALAQVEYAVANTSEQAVKAQQEQATKNMDKLSDDILEYVKLKQDADIKVAVYQNLVQQNEQAKIKQAMDSMDIQVVDQANLPKVKSAPRQVLMTAVAFVVGCILAVGYVAYRYIKEDGMFDA